MTTRDGKRSLALALSHAENGRNPRSLQLLACARAESGQYKEALTAVEEALALAKADPNTDPRLISQLNFSITVYQEGKPFRHPRY